MSSSIEHWTFISNATLGCYTKNISDTYTTITLADPSHNKARRQNSVDIDKSRAIWNHPQNINSLWHSSALFQISQI